MVPATLLILVVVVTSQLSSCASPAYYWQATSGHLSLMRARQPIDQVIALGELDGDTTEKLKLSREIISFAVDQLGLPDNGSYSEFVQTGRDAVVWNVIAAPEFSLEPRQWCFPVAGCVPYRGYFEQASAGKFAEKLRRQDLDVTISPATAYSTLGWFEDPLLDTMLRRSDTQFAALIFHELAHQQLYLKGDSRFNESYASFIESIGVKQWLEARGQPEAYQQWRAMREAERAFSKLLETTRDELREIYQSGANPDKLRSRKQKAFDRMQNNYSKIVGTTWGGKDYFAGWFGNPLNNARFALLDTYHGGGCAFAELFAQANGNFREFHALAKEKSETPSADRQAWLEQSCGDIAPEVEL